MRHYPRLARRLTSPTLPHHSVSSPQLPCRMPPSRFLPGTTVEIVRELRLAEPPRFAVFDFDGTLSLIREGWSDIMLDMMVPALCQTGSGETQAELTELCRRFLAELTGKPSIYQMIRFREELAARGGVAEDPETYLGHFRSELMRRVHGRRDELRGHHASPDAWLVPHAVEALNCLRERGVGLVLASGTDEHDVRLEAELLGLHEFFGDEIYGARPDVANSTKERVIRRILDDYGIDGSRLLGIGDGTVEIENIKAVGGTAVAVASDEAGRSGRPDPWKRERLIEAGADIVIPDFRDFEALCQYIWGDLV